MLVIRRPCVGLEQTVTDGMARLAQQISAAVRLHSQACDMTFLLKGANGFCAGIVNVFLPAMLVCHFDKLDSRRVRWIMMMTNAKETGSSAIYGREALSAIKKKSPSQHHSTGGLQVPICRGDPRWRDGDVVAQSTFRGGAREAARFQVVYASSADVWNLEEDVH